MPVTIALTTCPDETSASRIAVALVEEHLAACVNQLPGVISTYWWRGQVQRDTEVLLLIKTLVSEIENVQRRGSPCIRMNFRSSWCSQ